MKENIKSFCIYYMRDSPGVRILLGETKTRADCFLGVVRSRCPLPCPIVVQSSFSLFTGGTNRNGKLIQTFDEAGIVSGFTPNATCKIPSDALNKCD